MKYPTLPLAWYVDDEILAVEKQAIFGTRAAYVGSLPLVPEHGSYAVVPQHDGARMLVRDRDEVLLLSNVCAHRSMQLLEGRGTVKALVCPMHRWTYDLRGRLLGAPRYPGKPDLCLPRTPLQEWNGILFAGDGDVAADLAPLAGRPELDIRGYTLVQAVAEEQPVNWKIPVEVLLENYHAPFIHPGFTRYTDPGTWYDNDGTYDGERLMYQEMKPHADFARNPASATFERWQQAILRLRGGSLPPFAALVVLFPPSTIIEWWPFLFVVTTYVPRTPGSSLMVREFCFDPYALANEPEYADMAIAAWMETQRADDWAHEALQRGRALRHRREPDGMSGYEIYQSPMEESVRMFHDMVMREVSR